MADKKAVGKVAKMEEIDAAVERLNELVSESHCLCIGSGVTVKYVGSWKELLGSMLGQRFASNWLTKNKPYSAIARFAEGNSFYNFFNDADYLEIGEFLLSDNSIPRPEGFSGRDKEWQERLFSRFVSNMISEKTKKMLNESCPEDKAKGCRVSDGCPLAKNGAHSFAETFTSYRCFMDRVSKGGKRKGCMLNGGIDTTMAVVELCISGKIKFVIDYNFDLIIEETLCEAIKANKGTPVQEIHIWTYGSRAEPETVQYSDECKVVVHRGFGESDHANLNAANAIHFFHVHGAASGLGFKYISSQLVFSQHSYERYQGSPLNWSNQVLEYFLSRCNVVAVGFSGVDENFRHFAKMHAKAPTCGPFGKVQDAGRKMVLLKARYPYRDAIKKGVGKSKKDKEVVEEFLGYCTKMVTNYYRDYYHIDTEWVGDYADVAEVVSRIASYDSF